MARQGRFGRSTSGSQNLSSLIYSLLREERNDQEDTMIRSYRNNMRGGVSTNTFSSGGTTISATAASVYQWYLSQADLARQSGDNAGYNSLIQRAEEFRIASLGDQEALLSSAFNNSTSIDFSLFGGTGSGTLELGQFETLMTNLANNPSLTDADRSRIRLTLFTSQLTSTSGSLGREYDEGTKTADDLVKFYDKELERARAAGITTDSQLYQNILNARSKYIKAGEIDAANAKTKAVVDGIKDEQLAVAQALQKFLLPIFPKRFSSQSIVNALSATVTGDGSGFLNALGGAMQESGIRMSQLIYDAAAAAGYSQEQIATLLQSASTFSAEATRLAQLYPEQSKDLLAIARQLSQAAADGGFQSAGRGAAQKFQDAIAATGGTVGVSGTSDPYATVTALAEYAAEVGVIADDPTFNDANMADDAAMIAGGNLSLGSGDGSVKSVIDEILKTYPAYDKQNVMIALANLLSGSQAAWESKDALYTTIGRWVQNNGLDVGSLLSPIDPTIGGLTRGQVMQYAVEAEMARVVDADPNLVYVYRYDANTRTTGFRVASVADVKNDTNNYIPYTGSGKGKEIVYLQRINLKVSGGNSDASNVFLIALPGGEGTFGAGAAAGMDSNDYLEFNIGKSSVKLTLQDLQDIETFSGVSIFPPVVSPEDARDIVITPETYRALVGTGSSSPVTSWLYSESQRRGQAWFDSKFNATGGNLGSTGAIEALVASYVAKVTPLAQSRGESVDLSSIVSQVLTGDGITDKTGMLTNLILSQVDPIIYTGQERREWYAQFGGNGGRGGGIPEGVTPPWEAKPEPVAPPPPPSWDYNVYPQGRDYGNSANPFYTPKVTPPTFGPENLTPGVTGTGFDPGALPGYANPNQLSMPNLSAPMGSDFFFRKINTPQSSSGPTLINRPSKFSV